MLHVSGFSFFFSSRRRHTRYWRDWSSDVCSSDLSTFRPLIGATSAPRTMAASLEPPQVREFARDLGSDLAALGVNLDLRSEERRVGKECRSRWSPYH